LSGQNIPRSSMLPGAWDHLRDLRVWLASRVLASRLLSSCTMAEAADCPEARLPVTSTSTSVLTILQVLVRKAHTRSCHDDCRCSKSMAPVDSNEGRFSREAVEKRSCERSRAQSFKGNDEIERRCEAGSTELRQRLPWVRRSNFGRCSDRIIRKWLTRITLEQSGTRSIARYSPLTSVEIVSDFLHSSSVSARTRCTARTLPGQVGEWSC